MKILGFFNILWTLWGASKAFRGRSLFLKVMLSRMFWLFRRETNFDLCHSSQIFCLLWAAQDFRKILWRHQKSQGYQVLRVSYQVKIDQTLWSNADLMSQVLDKLRVICLFAYSNFNLKQVQYHIVSRSLGNCHY